MPKMCMHHSHELKIDQDMIIGKSSIFMNPQIMREIHLYTQAQVPLIQIHELIIAKYGIPASFDEVFRAALHLGN